MATEADVVMGVRTKMRDYPKMFQTDVVGDGLTQIFELPVVMVRAADLSVMIVNDTLATPTALLVVGTDYTLDARHGMLMLNGRRLESSETLNAFGWNYTWFLDEDILAEAAWYIDSIETSVNDDTLFENLDTADPIFELIVRGVLVSCLWSLLIETSLDIDVRNPEGVDIPASQRFFHLQNLVDQWTKRYEELAHQLNIGLDRIQVMQLRRTSRSTGKLVPVYASQEFDDTATPQRLYPVIDSGQFMIQDPPENEN